MTRHSEGGARRPSLPPLLWVATAAVAGSAAGTQLAWAGYAGDRAGPAAWGVAGAALAACVAACVASPRARRVGGPLLAAAFAGVIAAGAHGAWLAAQACVADAAGPRAWEGVVVSDPRAGLSGTRVVVALQGARVAGRFVVAWPEGEDIPEYGRLVSFSARLRRPDPKDVAAADAFARGEAGSGRPWRVRLRGWAPKPLGALARARCACLRVLSSTGGRGGPIVASAVFGMRDVRDEDAFRSVGAAHLLTASGLHLAVAVALAGWAARRLGAGRRMAATVSAATALAFCAAGGLRVSLLRAAFVVCAGLVPMLLGRRRDGLAAGAAAVAVLALLDPPAVFDVGLWIGCAACIGVGVFGGLATDWARAALPRRAAGVARTAAAAVAVQAGMAPVASAVFGTLTPLSPVASVLVAPLIQTVTVLALAGAALLPTLPRAGRALLRAATIPAAAAGDAVTTLAGIGAVALPTDAWPVAGLATWAVGCAALWVWWPRPRRVLRTRLGLAAAGVALAIASGAASVSPPRIVVLDVGQGDAILVQDGAATMLVDCGPDALSIRRALARTGVRRIGALVLTHPHADHTGGLRGLTGVATVGWVGLPASRDVEAKAFGQLPASAPVERLRAGACFAVGGWRVRVLWPTGTERRLETNDVSVALLVERPGATALLLGDGETRAQEGALRRFSRQVATLKVAHHGSVNGFVPEALAVWRPMDALVSVGEGNRFGHPAGKTLRGLGDAGAHIWRTDRSGDLTLAAGRGGASWGIAASRGRATVACARIESDPAGSPFAARCPRRDPERHARRPLGPQADLPHLRERGPAARARGPPAAGPVREGGGPRLQPGDLRRRLGFG